FNVLLKRYSNQSDIVVGTPIANRSRSEIQSLIGFFVNTLVIRTDLSDDPSFKSLVARLRNTLLQAYANQDLPFEKLVEELQPLRDLGRNPLFQVLLVFQHAPLKGLAMPGLTLSQYAIDTETAKFDLTLVVEEAEGRMAGAFEYNRDLFDAATIERMARHFQVLLN